MTRNSYFSHIVKIRRKLEIVIIIYFFIISKQLNEMEFGALTGGTAHRFWSMGVQNLHQTEIPWGGDVI